MAVLHAALDDVALGLVLGLQLGLGRRRGRVGHEEDDLQPRPPRHAAPPLVPQLGAGGAAGDHGQQPVVRGAGGRGQQQPHVTLHSWKYLNCVRTKFLDISRYLKWNIYLNLIQYVVCAISILH